MGDGRKHNEWMRDVNERQRNFVFPDMARNLGEFWWGIYEQKLNLEENAPREVDLQDLKNCSLMKSDFAQWELVHFGQWVQWRFFTNWPQGLWFLHSGVFQHL